jgi:hypothetical protein
MGHSEWVISDEFYDRLHGLQTTESGSPVSWDTSSANDSVATLTALTAFSWCFFLEVRMELADSALPARIPWLGDAVFGPKADPSDAVEIMVRGQDGYELSSSRPALETKGIVKAGGSATVMRDPSGVRGQRATGRYWCWPLPPSGKVAVALGWRSAPLNALIATLSGDTLKAAAQRSVPLDADMRHIRPTD